MRRPTDRRPIQNTRFDPETDDPTAVLIHQNHHPMGLEDKRLAAKQVHTPETVLGVDEKGQPGWTTGAGSGR